MRRTRIGATTHPDFIGPRLTRRQNRVLRQLNWRKENPEENREIHARSYRKRREKLLIKQREYYQKNKAKHMAYCKVWSKKRRESDPHYRALFSLRSRLCTALKGKRKSAKTMALLGCSKEFFIAHIELQFQPGMTWGNYGRKGWHIDHIRPCASFDLSDPEQQRVCFHYTNMQPLWALENQRKWCRISA